MFTLWAGFSSWLVGRVSVFFPLRWLLPAGTVEAQGIYSDSCSFACGYGSSTTHFVWRWPPAVPYILGSVGRVVLSAGTFTSLVVAVWLWLSPGLVQTG